MISFPGSDLQKLDRQKWPAYNDRPGTYGIITAADNDSALELKLLCQSIRRQSKINICVYDLGLEKKFVQQLPFDSNITIKSLVLEPLQQIGEHWQSWWKPLFIIDSPFDYTLWIDTNCIVSKDITELFGLMVDVPLIVADFYGSDGSQNDRLLYDIKPVKNQTQEVISSGVLGFHKHRDSELLQQWLHVVYEAASKQSLKMLIKGWDQGALLWVLEQLELTHLISYNKQWNYPARLQYYELENMLDRIINDHPAASIIRFTDLKLSNLIHINNSRVVAYRKNNGRRNTKRVFIVGPERTGLKILSTALATGCDNFCWIRHNQQPNLASEVKLLLSGKLSSFNLEAKLQSYRREDCSLIVEANSRLIFFLHQLYRLIPDCKIIILVRDPVQLIKSRMRAGLHWPAHINELPIFYQQYIEDNQLCTDLDRYRLSPPYGMNLIESHVWEAYYTFTHLLQQTSNIARDQVLICQTDRLREQLDKIVDFIDCSFFNIELIDTNLQLPRLKVPDHIVDWVDQSIKSNIKHINDILQPLLQSLDHQFNSTINMLP